MNDLYLHFKHVNHQTLKIEACENEGLTLKHVNNLDLHFKHMNYQDLKTGSCEIKTCEKWQKC